MDKKLQVPFAVDLTKEKGWAQTDKHRYFVARLNLYIDESQTSDFGFGDILRTFRTTDFTEAIFAEGFEEECIIVDERETTRSTLLTKELAQKITGTITAGVKTPIYEVSSAVSSSLEDTVRSSVEQSLKSTRSISRRIKKHFTLSQTIKSGAKELHYALAGYRKYCQKVYLHYIDYLHVEYRSSSMGLRKKKKNLPRPIGDQHINRIHLNIPLFTLYYWKIESESSIMYTESEYKQLPKVEHPDRVIFGGLKEEITNPLPSQPDRPTLYTLSNIAFPLRWIDRKGPWTKEELEEIELNEADGSAWWFQYGIGKNKK
jgi:hypothetical protein